MMPKHSSHLLELAKRGAEARFRELLDELKSLTSAFPHLRDSFDRDELPLDFILREGHDTETAAATQARPQRRMSAVQRKAVSVRMRKYWAARRKAEGRK